MSSVRETVNDNPIQKLNLFKFSVSYHVSDDTVRGYKDDTLSC